MDKKPEFLTLWDRIEMFLVDLFCFGIILSLIGAFFAIVFLPLWYPWFVWQYLSR